MFLCNKKGKSVRSVVQEEYFPNYNLFESLFHYEANSFLYEQIANSPFHSISKCFPLLNIVFEPALRGFLLTARPDGFGINYLNNFERKNE
jgi:hypothetical protein